MEETRPSFELMQEMPIAPQRLSGHAAIVTGGASGIGRAVAEALIEDGASVVIADVDDTVSNKLVAELRALGGEAVWLRSDVGDEDDCKSLVAGTLEEFGRLDILVNSAGFLQVKDFLEISAEDFDKMYRVHLRGTFLVSQAAVRAMIPRRYGRIVNISSGGALGMGSSYAVHYQAAKAGQAVLGHGIAQAMFEYGITVNTVVPSTVRTPLWAKTDAEWLQTTGRSAAEELSRRGIILEPEDVARVVLPLLLPDSDVNGETIRVLSDGS